MKLKLALCSLLIISASSFAGDELASSMSCDGSYMAAQTVDGINVSANWDGGGPAVNVKIGDDWYVKQYKDNVMDGFYQMAFSAYVLQEEVNACVSHGYLRGLEFANLE